MLVDGVDVRDLDPDLLWGTDRLRPAEGYLFSGTVASNLRFGRPEATDEELWEALEIAQASGFVQAMPDGHRQRDQPGRHQRVGRAAPTAGDRPGARGAAGDLRVRRLVLGARPRHRRPAAGGAGTGRHRRRRDVVAQRVSTIRNADQILVLDDGELVGTGTHDELLETCPTYAEIVASQQPRAAHDATTHRERAGSGPRRSLATTGIAGPRRGAFGPGGGVGMPVERSDALRRHGAPARQRSSAREAAGWSSWCCADGGRRGAGGARPAPARTGDRHHRRSGIRSGDGFDLGALHRKLMLVGGLYLAAWVLAYGQAYILAGVVQRTMYGLRESVETKIHRLPLSYIDRQSRGDLLSRVTNDIDNLAQSLQQTVEPDPHVAADADRRDRGDVHDLAAAGVGGADHGAAVAVDDEADRAARRARGSSTSGATPGASTARPKRCSPGTRS